MSPARLLIQQRAQAINSLRAHLGALAHVVPQGLANATKPHEIIEDPECDLPADAIPTLKAPIAPLAQLEAEIGKLDTEITRRAKDKNVAARRMTLPGIGPLIVTVIAPLAPPPETFRKAWEFSAWLVLTPRQHTSGGKQRLGATTTLS
ncbi:transposase [Citreicella sp. C3M06]|nr:transposase [Citreicella sp. C3M06]